MATKDVVNLLLDDHEAAEKLLSRIDDAPDLGALFCEIVQTLVTHEVAEEEIIYPAFRRIGGTDAIADARIGEQQEAEELLLTMEHMDAKSPDFRAKFLTLRAAVLEHAHKEERDVFPKLRSEVDADDLMRLGSAYTTAKKMAPTHPHPHAPNSPPGNLLVGPFIAMIDKARDAARSAMAKARS